MITVPIWLFVIICVAAVGGVGGLLYFMYAISRIRLW